MEEKFFRCDFCGMRISGKHWKISETTHCCISCEDSVGMAIDMISKTMKNCPDLYREDSEKLLQDASNEIH